MSPSPWQLVRTGSPKKPPKTKEERRDYHLQHNYGITAAQYDQMYASQDGKCAICRRESTQTLHVDHDHDTNKVRELLCSLCNTALGGFQDDRYVLQKAIEYLTKHA